MTFRADAVGDRLMRRVMIWLGDYDDRTNSLVVAVGVEPGGSVVMQTQDLAARDEPFLMLPEAAARALCDALCAHFGGTSDMRALRKDYEGERARVDRLLEILTAPKLIDFKPGGPV